MAETKKYYHNIDAVGNKISNLLLNPLTTAQRTTVGGTLGLLDQGYVVYDTDLNQQFFWDGTTWVATLSSTTWGSIIGTLTSQTDLINYLSSNYYPLSSNPAGYLTSSALTGYVPYSGATNNVNLGSYNLVSSNYNTFDSLWGDYWRITAVNDGSNYSWLDVIEPKTQTVRLKLSAFAGSSANENSIKLYDGAGGYAKLLFNSSTPNYTYTYPNNSGTLALSVNGNTPDPNTGDISISISPTLSLQQVTGVGDTVYNVGLDAYSQLLFNNYTIYDNSVSGATYIGMDVDYGSGYPRLGIKDKLGNTTSYYATSIIKGSDTFTFPTGASGTIALTSDIPSLSGYVPYTGATGDVDLQNNGLYTKNLFIYDSDDAFPGADYWTISVGSNVFGILSEDHSYQPFAIDGNSGTLILSSPWVVAGLVGLDLNNISATSTRNLSFPDASGTFALSVNGQTANSTGEITIPVGTGTVTAVTASSPLASSGGTTPNITIQQASGSQAGYLSSTDWTNFHNKLDGSGSYQTVAIWGGSGLTGSSIMNDYGTTIEIGGGVINTVYVLNVTGGIASHDDIAINTNNGSKLRFTDISLGLDAKVYIDAPFGATLYDLAFYTDNLERLRILDNGRICIGINYQAGVNSKLTIKGDGTAWAAATLNIVNSSDNSLLCVRDNGSIGIGTNTPSSSYKLDVNGGITSSSLAGTGTRMVIADSGGGLSTQTIPTGFTTPLTTKGDIYVRNGSGDIRLPVGLDTQILIADSTASTGLKWGSNTTPPASGYYGAWQDNVTQTAAASNTGYAMIFRTTDLSNGVSVVTNGTNLTRITFANTGVYNLQFSSQFQNTGNADADVTIWLKKNGTDVTGTAGFIQIPKRISAGAGNEGHNIVSWNYLLDIIGGDYYELMWSTSDYTNITMQYYSAGSPPPSAPSVILTVTQQAGILAGTGISRGVYSISSNTNAGNGANVDYVYLVSGTTTITLPTAVGNTNQYTIKNTGTNTVSIATTSSQTIDGSSSPITLPVQYTSLTLISNGSNWNII